MKERKKQRGITLVALIITIIILLILAVVAIRAVQGDGIIGHAKNARDSYQVAQEEEKHKLALLEESITGGLTGSSVEQVTDKAPGVLEVSETETNTLIINSIEDLVFLAYDVRQGNTYADKTVKLGTNLDFNSAKSYVNAFRTDYAKYGYNGELKTELTTKEGFHPIGVYDYEDGEGSNSFGGTFDGDGKTINNLLMYMEIEDNERDYVIALFGTNHGTIQNLGIENSNINIKLIGEKSLNVGTIIGKNFGTIENCYVSGIVSATAIMGEGKGTLRTGGIICNNSGTVKNCYNKANITVTNNNVKDCYVGGVTGAEYKGTTLEKCYNIGIIKIGGTLNRAARIGGISGNIGYIDVKNCYNCGKVEIDASNIKTVYVGGVMGQAGNLNKNIEQCYNMSSITVSGGDEVWKGSLIGLGSTGGTVINSSWLSGTAEKGIGDGVGESTEVEKIENMPSVLEIVGSAFKEDAKGINNGYPILAWQ